MSRRSLGHRAPLLWLVLPFMAGLVAGRVAGLPGVSWLLAAALLAAIGALVASGRASRWFAPACCAAMLLAGAASYALHRPRIAAWDRLPPREARLSLAIDRIFPQENATRVAGLATITQAAAPLGELVGQRVSFSLAAPRAGPAPIRSSVISAAGVIASLPREPAPGSFERYLADAGINFRLTRGRVVALERPANAYRQFCARQAARFTAMLAIGIAQKRPAEAAVLRAMLLGQQHELSDEQALLFRQSGTMHVFSISGLHIAVIAGGLHALLLLLRLPPFARFAGGLLALWFYVDITGGAPSAVRAFVMVALVEASFVLRMPRNPIAALAASALLILLVAPLQIFSASFQLSYGIVAALLLLGLPLAEHAAAALPLFRDLPKVTWRWYHHTFDTVWRLTLAAVSLGFAASLVSAVAGVMFFQLLTPGALLANLWLIPASTLVILAGFISLLCGLIGFTAGSLLANHAAVLVLWLIEHGVRAFAALPGAWIDARFRAEWIGPVALAALLGALLFGYGRSWRGWQRGYWTPVAVVALTLLLGVKLG